MKIIAQIAVVLSIANAARSGVLAENESIDRCPSVAIEVDEALRTRGPSGAAEVLRWNLSKAESALSTQCRESLVSDLGEACEQLDGVALHSCADILDDAIKNADIPLDRRWVIQDDVLRKLMKQQIRDGNWSGAEETLGKLDHVVAWIPEPIRTGFLRQMLLEKAMLYLRSNRLDAAEGAYSELLRSSQQDPADLTMSVFALQGLADIYRSQGKLARSRATLERVISTIETHFTGGSNSLSLVVPLDQYAAVLEELGEQRKAIEVRRRADRLR